MVVATNPHPRSEEGRASFPLEVAAVWALAGAVAIALLVTYARLPPEQLYHVSGSGLAGGASRVLVFANWPLALLSIPMLAVLANRLASRETTIVAIAGIALCAAVFWPGMVKESDLDAKPANAVAGLGVLVALALSVVAARRLVRPDRPSRQPGDGLRAVLAILALTLSLPWMAADVGVSFDGVPVLGTLYQTGELRSQPPYLADVHSRPVLNPIPYTVPAPDDVTLHPAVHHGHHHGMDGALLVLSALLLSRLVPSLNGWRRASLGAYLAVLFCYGAGNLANDYWLEQVVKRGWTEWSIPNVTTPKPSVAWAVIVVSAGAMWAIDLWRSRGGSSLRRESEVVA